MPRHANPALPSPRVSASFPTTHCLQAAGIAIFHLSSARVVLLQHPPHKGYFLPKGRRDAGEDLIATAAREGYEESGFPCAVLGVPREYFVAPLAPGEERRFFAEPVMVELMPVGERGWAQYILSWYVGRTIQDGDDGTGTVRAWKADGREPVRHEGTGVDEEERGYVASLVPVEEAVRLLRGSVQGEVVRRGWEIIQLREKMEEEG